MELQNISSSQLRELLEDILKNPGEFATVSDNMHPALVQKLHTLLIVTLLNLAGLQQQQIDSLLRSINTLATEVVHTQD